MAKSFSTFHDEIISIFIDFEEKADDIYNIHDDNNFDFECIISSIDNSVNELEEIKFDFMKNKISFDDFIVNIDSVKFSLELEKDDLKELEINDLNKFICDIINDIIVVLEKFINKHSNS